MPHPGQVLEGPGGFRLTLVELSEDALIMEARYPGNGQMPPEHLHPSQHERFEVIEGRVRVVLDGEEHRYKAGAEFNVPAGTPHQMAADGEALVAWEVRPALRTAEFFERLYTEVLAGRLDNDGVAAFFDDFSDVFRFTAGRP
jgi:mannose-6-phosphate isomerase-like protein (cupin superfamily)